MAKFKKPKLSPELKRNYYLNSDAVSDLILQDASEDNHIIYGAQAINAQLPAYLQKHTEDYDVYVDGSPKKEAYQMEKKLDRLYGGNAFSVKKGQYKDTWKVTNNITRRNTVDYTKRRKPIRTVQVYGNKFAALPDIKRSIKKTLSDERNAYRFDKDVEALQRIRLSEGGF